jgi:two-component system sensor kinase FixL
LLAAGRNDAVETSLQRIAEQTERARGIVAHLREFVRKGETEKRIENLPKTIEEASALALAGVKEKGVKVEMVFDPDAQTAVIDKVQIQQVVFNLVRNAIEAMEAVTKRELTIATVRCEDNMTEVSIVDTGPGLSETVRAKLFQPFVTTKPAGMGVGLSICRSIIESHGGRLWAEERSGSGTVFRFTVRHTLVEGSPAALGT